MKKPTRVIAGVTLIISLGVFAAPAFSVESETPKTVEETICEAIGPQRIVLASAVQAAAADLAAQEDDVNEAANDLDDSSTALGTTGLAYMRALDGTGNETGTSNAFQAAAAQFTEDIVTFVDEVDELDADLTNAGVNDAVLRYYTTFCPAPTPSPTPTPTPTASPTPTPSPSPTDSGGLGSLLSQLLGGLLG